MAYPKTTDEKKRAFIAQVINQLNERGENKKEECLRKHTNLHKQYEAAQRYSREMNTQDEKAAQSPTAPMTYEHSQEVEEYAQHVGYQSPYKNNELATVKRLTKERRKKLMEKHYELLDWIQCVDDGIVKGNLDEARRMVNVLIDYADRLDELIKDKFYNRAINLLAQYYGITASMQLEEVEEIKRQAEMRAPQYAK